ncbi:MAG: MarR family winged helix-turn-helix transcriptional regulator [Luteolibacter sp.]
MTEPLLTDSDYKRLADFRYALRRFLHFSERAAAQEGLKPQQHQAMLAIRGREAGTTTVGVLAERLKLRHHTTVELVQRLETAGLVTKHPAPADRRAVVLALTAEGSARLERLTHVHRNELKHLGPEIVNFLSTLDPS